MRRNALGKRVEDGKSSFKRPKLREGNEPTPTLDLQALPGDPLQYQNRLRFPRPLEDAYREDLADRAIVMQRHFIAFGFVVYGLFAVLDYYAMPRTHQTAWLLRALLEVPTAGFFWLSFKHSTRRRMYWLMNLWMLAMNCGILGMIMRAQQSELAFTFYPVGLMLVLICGYVASGDLGYASAQGWLAIIGFWLVGTLDQRMQAAPSTWLQFFTLSYFLVGINIVGMALGYTQERTNRLAFLQRLIIEQQRQESDRLRLESDRLLLNVLPASIADRLKHGEMVADHLEQVSVLFADLEGFTPYSANKTPAEVVQTLNLIFSAFDGLTEKFGLEKIKTVGDAYMVVSGLPTPRPDHLEALVTMAFEMQALMQGFRRSAICDLKLRIGINSGPVVAGIIGFKKFSYDLWGDTVNVASRMESFGIPGEIQVTEEVYRQLNKKYLFRKRGVVNIKGKGEMRVYLLKGCKGDSRAFDSGPAVIANQTVFTGRVQ
jgi:class 3 adenylate cyclase